MSESLSWHRDPEAEYALSDLLCGLIRDIRRILVLPDLGSSARLAAIRDTIDRLAPSPGLAAGGAQAAAFVVALLGRNSGPATIMLEELAGEPVRIELTSAADRELTDAECRGLHLAAGARGYLRTGTLCTVSTGMVAAEVYSVVVPGRLPASARRALGIPGAGEPAPPPSDIPLGKVLAGLGVRRESLGARLVPPGADVSGTRTAVESAARMWLADVPVALAGERLTEEFCQRAAGGSRLGGMLRFH